MKPLHTTLSLLFMAFITFNLNAQDIALSENLNSETVVPPTKNVRVIHGFLEASNVCSKQVMLVNRIAKDYMVIASNSRINEDAITELRTSISEFETQLEELVEYAPSTELKIDLQKMNFSWKFYKKLIFDKKTKANALKVLNYSERFTDEILYTLELFRNIAGKSSLQKVTNLISLSGEQRVLSQQIPLYYIAHKWGVKDNKIVTKFKKVVKTFESNLGELQENPMNTPGSSLYLNGLVKQFEFEKKGYKIPSELSVTEIYLFTNEIQNKMELITGLYQNIPKK